MYEKVNPSHPDKMADRIAGALVDMAYAQNENPRIAVEVLIGHGRCHIIAETSVSLSEEAVKMAVYRIAGNMDVDYVEVPQDQHLAENQDGTIRCGDNGIFKGSPITREQKELSEVAREIYVKYPYDGKYIIDGNDLVICQSNADEKGIRLNVKYKSFPVSVCFGELKINPLGDWTGGPDVDSGATNRKLGSDMGDAVTGGGLHGKDLSKADVSLNIYAHILAQKIGSPIHLCCAIGDEEVMGTPYADIVDEARKYVENIGGFEKLAEWGLI